MFFEGMRSQRQLERVGSDRLSVRYSLGYDLSEPLPDHSSLTRIRERYGLDTFRRFFERIVEQCQKAGLIWGQELYFDGTQVEANADDDKMLPRLYVEAMQTHLAALFPDQSNQAQDNSEFGQPSTNLLSLESKLPQAAAEQGSPCEWQGEDWISRVGRPKSREKNRYGWLSHANMYVVGFLRVG
jgi:hypothetical protein